MLQVILQFFRRTVIISTYYHSSQLISLRLYTREGHAKRLILLMLAIKLEQGGWNYMRFILAIRLKGGWRDLYMRKVWFILANYLDVFIIFFFHAKKSLPYIFVNALFSEFFCSTKCLIIFHCWFYEREHMESIISCHTLTGILYFRGSLWIVILTRRWTVNTLCHQQTSGD